MRRAVMMVAAAAVLAATIALPAGGATPGGVAKPAIKSWKIPFPQKRKREMRNYAERHYGISSYKLKKPRVIVQHVAVAGSAEAVYNTFAPDNPDPELGELPNVCSHFVVDSNGTIYKLVNVSIMCRHTVGLNYTAIGIEHVGFKDSDVLGNKAQMRGSLALSHWLRCKHGIEVGDVIGHNESLDSPYHKEKVKKLRKQTHGDMKRSSMRKYRKRLRNRSC